jgi:hypothetical protein
VRLKRTVIVTSVVLTAVIVLCGAAVAWLKLAPRRVPTGQRPLATLSSDSLPGFRAAFNAADGKVRILALLSPT